REMGPSTPRRSSSARPMARAAASWVGASPRAWRRRCCSRSWPPSWRNVRPSAAMSEPIQDQLEGSPDPVLEALRRLVEQIERADFRDRLGHPLKMNLAYIEAP